MPSQLSSLLVRDGLTTPKRIERALVQQVVRGGALDTNLLELEAVPEDRLTQYLSLATGLPAASKGETDIFDAEALRACPRAAAEHAQVAPLSLRDSVLRVLVCEPVDLGALENLANELGVGVQPMVVPEYRFHVIFARIFGTEPSERYAELERRQQGVAYASPGGVEPVVFESRVDRVVVDVGEEPRPRRNSAPPQADASVLEPAAETTPLEESAPSEDPTVEDNSDPRSRKLAIAEARRALEAASDRDEIFELLLRGVRSVARYACLLTIQGNSAVGRMSLQDGAFPDDEVVSALIALDTPSPFKSAFTSAAPFIGSIASSDPAIDDMTRKMGGVMPAVAMILPIAVRGRVVAMAVGHSGADTKWVGSASTSFVLSSDCSAAIERVLIARAKKKDPVPEEVVPEDPTTKVDSGRPAAARGKRKRRRSAQLGQ